MVTLTIQFRNGSFEEREFPSGWAARLYARDNISYSGDRVVTVVLRDEYRNPHKLWDATWTAESQRRGLECRP